MYKKGAERTYDDFAAKFKFEIITCTDSKKFSIESSRRALMMRYHSELKTHVVLQGIERYEDRPIQSVRDPIKQVRFFVSL